MIIVFEEEIILKRKILILKVPANETEILHVCNRIGPTQTSYFGEHQSIVRADLTFADRAYTHQNLPAHTDLAYVRNTAGLEMFHVIQKPADGGGKSLLVDGFYCADRLRLLDKRAFEFLARTHVETVSEKQGVCHFRHWAPVIDMNPVNGELKQIR